jgi:trigger factor
MQVRIEEVSPIEKKLVVEVPWATVSEKIGAAFRELAKSVNLKGFRKGKVPRSVLEQMFGKRVRAEVAEQLVRESFITATTEHSLDAVSEPRVEEELAIHPGKPFAFEAIVEVKGEITPKDYTGMELTKRPVSVADEAIEHAILHLQREHTELLPIENRDVVADTDVVAISIKGSLGEHKIDRQLTLDLADREHEPLPGLSTALVGLPIKSEAHPIEIAMPADHAEEAIAGKTAQLTVTILDARQTDVPALDDDFAKDTGKAESMDGLRNVVRDELTKRATQEIENEVRDAALRELVKRNQIPIASSLVDRAVEMKLHRLQSMFGVKAKVNDLLDDDLRKRLRADAEDDVRGQLLVEAVADAEKIDATDEDINGRVASIAEMRNQQPARLRAEMDRDGRLDNLRFQLRQEKTLDFLVSKATVTEKEPDPAELAAAAGAHAHAHDHGPDHDHDHDHVHGPDCDHGHEHEHR